MKSSRKWPRYCRSGCRDAGRAELAQWAQHVPGGSGIRRHFLPRLSRACRARCSRRKPPRETVAELTKQIAAAPSRADLVSLRAQEAELNLDFATADQDWKTFATMSPDKQAGSVALADYYHRRLQPQEELSALLVAASQPSMGRDALNADSEQRSWNCSSAQSLWGSTGVAARERRIRLQCLDRTIPQTAAALYPVRRFSHRGSPATTRRAGCHKVCKSLPAGRGIPAAGACPAATARGSAETV